eukprot:jgi/Galph1/6059/GphlegSOOS_G4641.1
MERWKDTTALVTGATAGIGKQICEQLVEHGVLVVGIGRRKDKLEQLAASLESSGAKNLFLGITADIRKEEEVKKVIKQANDWNGDKGIHILVNSAGVGFSAKLVDGNTDQWEEMWQVNVLGLSIVTREVIQDMKKHDIDNGHIFHISSMAAHRPIALSFYSATKAAVKMLGDCLRQELREANSNIRVSMISPGHVETEFYFHVGGEEFANKLYRSMKCLEARDVANGVIYMLSCPSSVDIHDIWMRPRDMKF